MKKKLLTSIFAASLVLGSVAPASNIVSANTEATITIQSTKNGAVYTPYKIFDATVAGSDVDGTGVSYTIPANLVNTYTSNSTFKNLFDTVKNGELTYAIKKNNTTEQQIVDWIKGMIAAGSITQEGQPVTENQGDGVETLTVPYGYYFIKSSVGNNATAMVTSAAPNATIREKNNEPTWGDDGGKTVDSQTKTYNVGDTIVYTLNYNNATFYSSGDKVYQYVVKDTFGQGIKFQQDSIEVYVNDKKLTLQPNTAQEKDKYSVQTHNDNFVITIPWAATNSASNKAMSGNADDFFYQPISKIKVVYKGVLTSAANEGSTNDNKNKNTATINPNTKQGDQGKTVHVYDGQITIKKVDGQTQTKTLKDAKFVLKRKGSANFLKFDSSQDKWLEVTTQEAADKFVTQENGTALISGLAAGEYELIEIEAPKGYNLKKDPTPVSLKFDENTGDGNDTLLATPQIENNQGAELPSTGGLGTTIFYAIGASLMIGSGVVLVARRRLRD